MQLVINGAHYKYKLIEETHEMHYELSLYNEYCTNFKYFIHEGFAWLVSGGNKYGCKSQQFLTWRVFMKIDVRDALRLNSSRSQAQYPG